MNRQRLTLTPVHFLGSGHQGYGGFNKVNLNTWKKAGFQQWLNPSGDACSETVQPVLEAVQKPVEGDSNR